MLRKICYEQQHEATQRGDRMKTISKLLLSAISAGFCLVTPSGTSLAAQQPYPNKPIRLMVASAPGGPNDLVARMVAAPWGELLGRPIVVDNRAGAAGVIGT